MQETTKTVMREGMRDSIPIALGYLAVSFSLGIIAANAGLTAGQGFWTSFFCMASAGEYIGFTLIAAQSAYTEVALMTLIANARYLLMSAAWSQRISSKTSVLHRLIMALDLTDELFAIAIARKGHLNPWYSYGAAVLPVLFWAGGTALGCIAGDILPRNVVSALSVALYGMFIAIIIPPAKNDKVILWLVVSSFVMSLAAKYLPLVNELSNGTRIILLTIIISSAAALLHPHKTETEEEA